MARGAAVGHVSVHMRGQDESSMGMFRSVVEELSFVPHQILLIVCCLPGLGSKTGLLLLGEKIGEEALCTNGLMMP